jgi:hypothetical protein
MSEHIADEKVKLNREAGACLWAERACAGMRLGHVVAERQHRPAARKRELLHNSWSAARLVGLGARAHASHSQLRRGHRT